MKHMSEFAREEEVHFIKAHLTRKGPWVGKAIRDIGLPGGVLVAVILRGQETIVPRGDVILVAGDTLVLGAEPVGDDRRIELKELLPQKHHPWNGPYIRDLDISPQTIIFMVECKRKMLIPKGDLILLEGDKVLLYLSPVCPMPPSSTFELPSRRPGPGGGFFLFSAVGSVHLAIFWYNNML